MSAVQTLVDSGITHTPAGEARPLHSHISSDQGAFLQRVIRELRPSRTLEIGCAYGISTLYLCEALREVGAEQHTVIDPLQHTLWENIGLENIRRAGYQDLVTWINDGSELALPRLLSEGRTFDFVFIDGWHTFDAAFLDFVYAHWLLRAGGVIAFDDVGYLSVSQVVRFAITNFRYAPLSPVAPVPLARRLLRALLRSRLALRNVDLGIPPDQMYIALRKTNPITRGTGEHGTQRWDDFAPF